jgi:hypothetical protein
MSKEATNVGKMILVPSLITLAVTLLRLVGELNQWSETFFRRSAGGAGAIVGIVWLAFIFAIYFAVKLVKRGEVFDNRLKAIGLSILAFIVYMAGSILMVKGEQSRILAIQTTGILILLVGVYLMKLVWPAYWRLMLAYAVAARVPVIVIMYFAIRGNWNTHYDIAPPNATFPDLMSKFFQIALLPQLFAWVPFTVVFCGLFGIVTATLLRRPASTPRPDAI